MPKLPSEAGGQVTRIPERTASWQPTVSGANDYQRGRRPSNAIPQRMAPSRKLPRADRTAPCEATGRATPFAEQIDPFSTSQCERGEWLPSRQKAEQRHSRSEWPLLASYRERREQPLAAEQMVLSHKLPWAERWNQNTGAGFLWEFFPNPKIPFPLIPYYINWYKNYWNMNAIL